MQGSKHLSPPGAHPRLVVRPLAVVSADVLALLEDKEGAEAVAEAVLPVSLILIAVLIGEDTFACTRAHQNMSSQSQAAGGWHVSMSRVYIAQLFKPVRKTINATWACNSTV